MAIASVHASNLEFKTNWKPSHKISLKQIKRGRVTVAGQRLVKEELKIYNIWHKHHRVYEGYSLFSLLDSVYGTKWRQAKQINFVALDGYRQSIAVHKMLKAANKRHRGLVAYKESSKTGFTQFKRKNKWIDPGPLYLLWSGHTKADIGHHQKALKWPYQLKTINVSF